MVSCIKLGNKVCYFDYNEHELQLTNLCRKFSEFDTSIHEQCWMILMHGMIIHISQEYIVQNIFSPNYCRT